MKQFLSILLVMCLSLAVLTGCTQTPAEEQAPGTTLPSGSSEPETPTNPNESIPGPDSKLKGEPITEDQFNALKTSVPTNYTCTEMLTYNGKTRVTTMLISGQEYLQTCVEDNTTRKIMGIIRNGQVKNYIFNEETGKWETFPIGLSASFPLKNIPMSLADFTYDETTGAYTLMTEGGEFQMMFKNGQLVFLGLVDGANQAQVFFSDYGTTVIPKPSESDIVDKNNTNNSAPSDDK